MNILYFCRTGIADLELVEESTNQRIYIWGTRVCIEEVQIKFKQFITTYRTEELDDDENAIRVGEGDDLVKNSIQFKTKFAKINFKNLSILKILKCQK